MSKEIKIEIYKCEYADNDYDDLGKYCWCKNKDCPSRECWCDNTIEHEVCPYFNKSKEDKPVTLVYDEDFVKEIKKKFVEKLLKDCQDDLDRNVINLSKILDIKEKLETTIVKLRNYKND